MLATWIRTAALCCLRARAYQRSTGKNPYKGFLSLLHGERRGCVTAVCCFFGIYVCLSKDLGLLEPWA